MSLQQHPTQRDSFKLQFLQSSNTSQILCLDMFVLLPKYYCAQFVSVDELPSKWSFVCFICALKVSVWSITNLDPHIYRWEQRYNTVSLNHCAFMKRKLCRYWKHIAGVLTPMLRSVCTVCVRSDESNRLKLPAMFLLYFSSKTSYET